MNTNVKEEIKEMSMIEIAFDLLLEAKKPLDFKEMFARVSKAKELTEEQQMQKIANLYTDLNVDGRFINIGDNQWGLKKWYPLERIEEEFSAKTSKKRLAKTRDEDEDYDFELEDEEFLEDDDDEKLDGFDEEFEDDEEVEEEY